MILQIKTLEKLRNLINEETEYRSGPQLIKFFNNLGFNDTYGQGFPSRWLYTDEKLNKINGTPEIDKCIKNLFAPVNFIGKYDKLDKHIEDFNQYLAFDEWKVVRDNKNIIFQKKKDIELEEVTNNSNNIDDFLQIDFNEISLDELDIDNNLNTILKQRLEEIKSCLKNDIPLSVIFLSGSTLEGILLAIALKSPKQFNISKAAPKENGKVKNFPNWTLNNLIDVAYDIGILKEDVKKFSHSLRDFRNYIHPHEQLMRDFHPDKHTAKISWQVLKAAIYQIELYHKKLI